jgi:hypothetical protein
MDLESYLVNMPKQYVVKRRELFRIIKDYKLKAVKGPNDQFYILFADVYKEFIKRAFEFHNVNKFKVSSKKVKDKLKKGWKKKETETLDGMILRQLAATTIQRHYLKKLNQRKAAKLAK